VLSKCIFRYISIAPVQLGGTTLREGFESDQSYRGDNTDQCLPSRKRKSQACGTALNRLHYYPHDTTVTDLKKRAHQSGTCQTQGCETSSCTSRRPWKHQCVRERRLLVWHDILDIVQIVRRTRTVPPTAEDYLPVNTVEWKGI
jgi:hypothetical protein